MRAEGVSFHEQRHDARGQEAACRWRAAFPDRAVFAEEEIADESGAALAELRAMGFNTVFSSGGLAQKPALDRIAAAGLWVQFRPPGSLNSQFDELEKTVAALRTNPALLLWEHEDEPVLNKSASTTRSGTTKG